MSTFAFAKLQSNSSAPGGGGTALDPTTKTYLAILAGLVPAEVLAVHATIMSYATMSVDGATKITDPTTVTRVFYALIVLSMVIYVAGRWGKKWDLWAFAGMLVPPAAFVGWTMLQQGSSFDAAFPGIATLPRLAIALIGAVTLAVLTGKASHQG